MTHRNPITDLSEPFLHPPLAAPGEDRLEVAFKERAGVLEVLFGVGLSGAEADKSFVQHADNPLLLGKRRHRQGQVRYL